MASNAKIQSFTHVVPMIYAYNTPGVTYHAGWTKIGYTEKKSPAERIKEQTHTADIKIKIAWQDNAMYKDGSGEYFTDHEFHSYLESNAGIERTPGTEWFKIDGDTSKKEFEVFTRRETIEKGGEKITYQLRKEQDEAVAMTKDYFENGGTEFLWNAKPRFGKTLSSYDLIQRMKLSKVLIVTNRPSISNSWAEDFNRFVGWKDEYCFVTDSDALKGKPGVMTRNAYVDAMQPLGTDWKGMIAFESLQNLKGSVYFGGSLPKLSWIKDLEFDMLIVDEAQEGVDTIRTDRAFKNIKRKYTLYMSGTPFKALANEQFREEQIYNWSYADEQEAKEKWDGEDTNPYETLPRLAMFTYQLSNMIYDEIQRGIILDDDEGAVDYAFDLNEFFATTESGKFIHEDEIRKFLHALTTQEKYPFSTPELRQELSHTLWLLNRVASAKALAKLLEEEPAFEGYKIVLAAGDGRLDDIQSNDKAFDRVKDAIANNEKTITLSVGQLTVGVTIPEWSGVLMLCNLTSPSSYMQAAFRAQNPCIVTKNGQRYRKETAYVFDFDPARTLIIFDEFANNLSGKTAAGKGTSDDRKNNIKKLLNFFPVLGEDENGEMVELDAANVLSIPRRIKSQEVVRRGFMSNFLFQNISNIFGAPAAVREIIEKMEPAHEEPGSKRNKTLEGMENVKVDEEGNVDIPTEILIGKSQELFGKKIYEDLEKDVHTQIESIAESEDLADVHTQMHELKKAFKESVKERVLTPASEEYEITRGMQNRIEKQIETEIDRNFDELRDDYIQTAKIAKVEFDKKQKSAESPSEVKEAEAEYNKTMSDAMNNLMSSIQNNVQKTIEEKPIEVIEQLEKHTKEKEKKTVEDKVRDHLRGFSRTIPSFIMAYGDGKLTLGNFDDYTEDDVFYEVTGITEDEFRFLRDGGEYTNEETGETEHFAGHLFDEVVFNDSIEEFWKKKTDLADYFDESLTEDIFDYIPPQKTNQIFTPRWVVSKMVDELEENNPGCYDDPENTFADLYMKSGLYITEIVKRLYRSKNLKKLYPDDKARIKHIIENQVYGMAPTRIIYLIATNYILGFDEKLLKGNHNFVEADAAEASKNGELESLVEKHFGNKLADRK